MMLAAAPSLQMMTNYVQNVMAEFPERHCIGLDSTPLVGAIVGHLVGDYLLKNDWMALNKKKSDFACTIHCLIWTFSVLLFAGWHGFWICSILYSTHFIQDRTQIIGWWMRLPWKNQSKFAEPPMAPWSLIVVDNVWHILTLWAVWRFMT